MWSGFASAAFAATSTTTPSVAIAAFSEIIASEATLVRNRSARASIAGSSSISRKVRTLTPASGVASDSVGANTPSTSTSRCVPLTSSNASAFSARAIAA
jgi:hypothetical protein